jgi:hypothetical protein
VDRAHFQFHRLAGPEILLDQGELLVTIMHTYAVAHGARRSVLIPWQPSSFVAPASARLHRSERRGDRGSGTESTLNWIWSSVRVDLAKTNASEDIQMDDAFCVRE